VNLSPNPALIAALILSAATLARGAPFTIGLLPGSDAELEQVRQHQGDAPNVVVRDLRPDLAESATPDRCRVIVATSVLVTERQVEILQDYVAKGGVLVVMGKAGERVDADADGRLSGKDPRVWAFAKLCGVSVSNVVGSLKSLRIWGYSPFFLGFQELGPLELAPVETSALLVFCEDAVPFASVRFEPKPARVVEGCAEHGWYRATRCFGEALYLSRKRVGPGAAIYVAENLLAGGLSGWRRLLLANLLTPLALALAEGPAPALPVLAGADGNLVFNGDMESCCTIIDGEKNNSAAVPYQTPAGWSYNTWGGGIYEIRAREHEGGGRYFSGAYRGDAGVAGNSACVLRWRHFLAVPRLGAPHRLRHRLRCDREVRVGLWGKLRNGRVWRHSIAVLSGSAEGWREYDHTFKVPLISLGDSEPELGFWLDFAMSGDGRIDLDDVVLELR